MNTTPLPPLPTPKGKVWPPAAFDDDQMQAYATAARADLEAENKRLKLIAKALLSAVTATGSNGKAILGKMLTDGDPDLIAAMAALKDTK